MMAGAWYRIARVYSSRGWPGWLCRAIVPLLLLCAVWWPEVDHFRFDRSNFQGDLQSADRSVPPALLAEIAAMDMAEIDILPLPADLAHRAVHDRELSITGMFPGTLRLEGYPSDIERGPPTLRWFMAGLGVERLMLDAHRATGDRLYLETARVRIRQFAQVEMQSRWDNGFLWNDHSVANRASVLVALWLQLRSQPDALQADGRELLSLVLRTGRVLAKPGHFTVKTNHGVIQNLALLQLSAAFPGLAEAPDWRRIAAERLALQLPFYVSREGVILEHSPRYHAIGTKLLAYAQRLLTLNALPASTRLDQAVANASMVLNVLKRPGHRVPAIGNSDSSTIHPEQAGISTSPGQAQHPTVVWPVAGWLVNWSGPSGAPSSQLMLTWSKHDGHGHKHADETAFTWWADGQEWITLAGYWPYGHPLVRDSYGWNSANAVHRLGEPADSARIASLLDVWDGPGGFMADLERRGADGSSYRRQLVQVDARTLVVLDHLDGTAHEAELGWTFGVGLDLSSQDAGQHHWVTQPRADGLRLHLTTTARGSLKTNHVHGPSDIVTGWTTVDRVPTAVHGLQMGLRNAGGLIVSVFRLDKDTAPIAVDLNESGDTRRWQIRIGGSEHLLEISRSDGQVSVGRPGHPPDRWVRRAADPTVEAQRSELDQAFKRAVAAYPPWRSILPTRARASQAIGAMWLLGELALGAMWLGRHRAGPRAVNTLPAFGLWLAWSGLVAFLFGYVLRLN